jgi:hypothetical protein
MAVSGQRPRLHVAFAVLEPSTHGVRNGDRLALRGVAARLELAGAQDARQIRRNHGFVSLRPLSLPKARQISVPRYRDVPQAGGRVLC